MKQLLFTVCLLMLVARGYGQGKPKILNLVDVKVNSLDTLKFDNITAYTINFDASKNRRRHDQMFGNVDDYDLSPIHASAKRKVDVSLFDDIITLFSDKTTYGDNYADCFEPRFVLQFQYKGQEKFRIIICEGCGHLISSVPIPGAYLKYYDNEFEEKGKPVIFRRYLKGFSEAGAKKINALCKKLKMAYCAK